MSLNIHYTWQPHVRFSSLSCCRTCCSCGSRSCCGSANRQAAVACCCLGQSAAYYMCCTTGLFSPHPGLFSAQATINLTQNEWRNRRHNIFRQNSSSRISCCSSVCGGGGLCRLLQNCCRCTPLLAPARPDTLGVCYSA